MQAAQKIVLEPVVEADFLPVSFGFGPRRSAHDCPQVPVDECGRAGGGMPLAVGLAPVAGASGAGDAVL